MRRAPLELVVYATGKVASLLMFLNSTTIKKNAVSRYWPISLQTSHNDYLGRVTRVFITFLI
jgi:hypothetical protein